MKFVDVKNDVAFRKIFGNSQKKEILISFLNAILKLDVEEQLLKLKFLNYLHLLRVPGENATIIDVEATDKKGKQYIIELQFTSKHGFEKHINYYACSDYAAEIDSRQTYALIKPTHFIGILDFPFFDSPHYLSHHIIVNGETYEHKLKDIQFAFIELKKFHLTEKDLKTLIEKWVFFIKNAASLAMIPKHVNDDGLKEAYQDADKHSWNKEELRAYDNASIAIQDARGKLEAAKKEGKQETQEYVIKKGWQKNMPVEEIAELVDLTVAEITAIINQLKNDGL